MEEKEEKKVEEQKEKKKKKDELPFCTNAPSAEHTRANLADDPCDDYREGE
jgi:hypothetical protein